MSIDSSGAVRAMPETAASQEAFEWHGYRFPANARVLLDLHGTNRDPRVWEDPDAFRPERFSHWNGSAFNFIAQGSGDHLLHHRCPGEWVTIELMKTMLDFVLTRMTYDVPEQPLEIDEARLPAVPRSRMIVANVRPL
jgi:fatty-acid peroxygenase